MKILISCLLLITLVSSTQSVFALNNKKVLLIGIDGLQYEKLKDVATPNYDRLILHKAYTGGIQGTPSQQDTKSGPGWSTILTGVWANKHRVTSNDSGLANEEFPSLFKRIKEADNNHWVGSISNWSPINSNFFTTDLEKADLVLSGLSDADVTARAIQEISSGHVDFLFLHLDDPDGAGHSSCFGDRYNESIRTSDTQLGELLNAVDSRIANGEEWLVLVTTDHGRDTRGCGHGSQTVNEKTIFIGSNLPLNAEHNDYVEDIQNKDFGGIYGYSAQTSIAPTILRFMDIDLQTTWKLDGNPLIGSPGTRKLMSASNTSINWYSTDSGPVEVYQNDQLIDVVDASTRSWTDYTGVQGILDYVLVYNDTPVALRKSALEIIAGLDWNGSRAYYFRGDNQYVRYNKILDKTANDYPRTTDNSSWPGLGDYANQIVAAFKANSDKGYFFLSDGRYLRYDLNDDQVDSGYPKLVDNNSWPGMASYASKIRAALKWPNSKVYFFLEDGNYLRYDLEDDQLDSGYPKPINDNTWPGLGAYATEITAAHQWNMFRAYFFLKNQRYIRYSITTDQANSGYPRITDDNTWPGLMNP
ncbi:alkaline phosphatase family protein [Microbulbifer variabilis]|uniref:alkaline phosphatase family protein n=1 Tax=Microbulbifer variabilis TaxID=266805 RepID=UPI001CFCC67A|nr:alkaline phosphatase family protein [Microbulbifer variabilis]